MISTGAAGNRVFFGYGTNKGGIVQIVDREKLINGRKEPRPENLRHPEVSRLELSPLTGAHTAFPFGKMRIGSYIYIVDRASTGMHIPELTG